MSFLVNLVSFFLVSFFLHGSMGQEYLGVPLGTLRNASLGIVGQVWLANSTAIQISSFSIEPHQKQEMAFAFVSEERVEPVKSLYKLALGNNGEEVLVPVKKRLNGGMEASQLVAIVPEGTAADWKQFGLVAGKSRRQLAMVPVDKPAPQPFCCIHDKEEPGRGIIGDHYSASTGPILVEDSKTLVLHKFILEADKAPDAWIFAGRGEVRQVTGKKARVLGRDTLQRHCSLRDLYSGDKDLRVRLAQGQDIYQLDYLSMFCYQYDVDFGHISFKMDPSNPVPAYIPEPSPQQNEQPELLESNDIEGRC